MTIDKLIKDFSIHKINIDGRSKKSIDIYIKNFHEFCEDMNINTYEQLLSVNAQTIKDWLVGLAEKGNSNSTRNNKLSAIKQIFLFLENEKEELVDRKISRLNYAKTPYKESKYIDEELALQLISATKNQRTKCAIMLIVKTGVRFQELMQITCSDIERGYTTIIGKGNKERTIWFAPIVINLCNNFINGKRKKIVEKTKVETDLLLISNNGTPMTRQSFSKSLKNLAEDIGLYWSDEVSPHKLRHGCITDALKDGVPINVVRDMVGHSNMYTTNRYAHTQENQIKNAMLRAEN